MTQTALPLFFTGYMVLGALVSNAIATNGAPHSLHPRMATQTARRRQGEFSNLISLLTDDQSLLFTQLALRAPPQAARSFSMGLGYRYTLSTRAWHVGVNGFFDHDTDNPLLRFTIGAEAQYKTFGMAFNRYLPGSSFKRSALDDKLYLTCRPVGGGDVRVTALSKRFPWVAGQLNFEHYAGESVNLCLAEQAQCAPCAVSIGFELKPRPPFALTYAYQVERQVAGGRRTTHAFGGRFRISFLESLAKQFKRVQVPHWHSTIGSRTALVNRQTMIMTETVVFTTKPNAKPQSMGMDKVTVAAAAQENPIQAWVKKRGNYNAQVGDAFLPLLLCSAPWPKELGIRVHKVQVYDRIQQHLLEPMAFEPNGPEPVSEYLELRLEEYFAGNSFLFSHFTPAHADGTEKQTVKGDGDCFFYSVYQQLPDHYKKRMGLLHKTEGETVSTFRKWIADQITPELLETYAF